MSHVQHQLQLTGLDLQLDVIELSGQERLGGLYRYEIVCEAPVAQMPVHRALSCRAALQLGAQRSVWGQVTAARLSHSRGVPRWHLTLEPRLARLAQVRLNQVFLNQSSVETVQTVLAQYGLSAQWQDWQLESVYPAFAQRSCHEQAALHFIFWLLEYEGIGLRFEHTPSGERLVFFDALSGYDRSSSYMAGIRVAQRSGLVTEADPDTLTHAAVISQPQVHAVRLTEYDHLQAQQNLLVESSGAEGTGQTLHAHGEHYKSVTHGEQLAAVRLQARSCRKQLLRGEGPLIELQAGRVIHVLGLEDSALWLVTDLRLQTHRDGSLQTQFEATPAESMWRPERVTPRPRVHGLLAAKISQGSPIARLDELGRYLVHYPWQAAAQSKLIRMAQPYAGPNYGTHAPLKDNTEVWLTHANGDPDRPLILGATHHSQEGDVVTAQDNSRNVIRTRAGNKLRLEDRQGQEHLKLHTPHGTSQLILGHAVDHAKQQRGQGVELRTQMHGVIRSGHQLFVTTGQASPRSSGEAQRNASSAEVRATLSNLQSFIGNRSLAASQVGAKPHQSLGAAEQVGKAMQQTASQPLGASEPNQVHWAQAGHVAGAPTLLAGASRHLGVWSIAGQDWLAGGKLQIATKDATRLHIEQGGRKAFISDGNFETTVSKGKLHIVVQGNLTIQSSAKDLSFKAQGSSLKLTAGGHAGLKSAGKTVYQTGKHKARAGAVQVQGGSAAQVPQALRSTALIAAQSWLEIHHHYDDLEPVANAPYTARFANGQVFEGTLNEQGFARLEGVPGGVAQITLGEDSRMWLSQGLSNTHLGQAGSREAAQRLIQDLLRSPE